MLLIGRNEYNVAGAEVFLLFVESKLDFAVLCKAYFPKVVGLGGVTVFSLKIEIFESYELFDINNILNPVAKISFHIASSSDRFILPL